MAFRRRRRFARRGRRPVRRRRFGRRSGKARAPRIGFRM